MPIWIGDFLHNRKPLEEDGLVLMWGEGGDVLAAAVSDNINHIQFQKVFTWDGEVPEEHPDDIAFDQAAKERMKP
jgi:hypothetical protein